MGSRNPHWNELLFRKHAYKMNTSCVSYKVGYRRASSVCWCTFEGLCAHVSWNVSSQHLVLQKSKSHAIQAHDPYPLDGKPFRPSHMLNSINSPGVLENLCTKSDTHYIPYRRIPGDKSTHPYQQSVLVFVIHANACHRTLGSWYPSSACGCISEDHYIHKHMFWWFIYS